MAKISILQGATSVSVNIFIADSSSTTGAGLTGLVFNTASLTCYYMRPKIAATSVTLATLAAVTSAYSSGGFKEIDATNAAGWYRFDIPDAAIANAERFCSFHFKGATNMAPLPLEVELTAVNNQSAATFMTGVNGVAPPTNWNLTSIDASGRLDVIKIAGTTQTARDIGASVLLSNGTGAGQLKLASGYVAMTWADIAAPTTVVALTGTTIAVTQKVDVDTIKTNPVVNGGTITFPTTATLASTTNITAGTIATVTNLTNAPTNGDFTATMKTSIGTAVAASAVASVTGNVGGNVTGSVGSVVGAVGSVTGAVGSVTGNVGGNVVGTVASVVGNVGGNVTGTVASVVGNVGGNVTGSVGSVVGAVGSVTGAVGSVTGAVGSVTGAVGSVTGNVGGNVVGTVASVVGAVGSVTGNVGGNVTGSVGSVVATVTATLSATGSAAFTESYAADGATATLPQLLYGVKALLGEFAITGTTLQTKRLDGTTNAEGYTLDSATDPTSITRSS